jgi:hypothetical protein
MIWRSREISAQIPSSKDAKVREGTARESRRDAKEIAEEDKRTRMEGSLEDRKGNWSKRS